MPWCARKSTPAYATEKQTPLYEIDVLLGLINFGYRVILTYRDIVAYRSVNKYIGQEETFINILSEINDGGAANRCASRDGACA